MIRNVKKRLVREYKKRGQREIRLRKDNKKKNTGKNTKRPGAGK